MAYITDKQIAAEITGEYGRRGVPMGVLGTASHWNTEAILIAVRRVAVRHGIERPAVAPAITFTYPHMPQAKRVTVSGDPRVGFLSILSHLRLLTDGADAPYGEIAVLPHLDHAHPENDRWALTEGLEHLASVMFDAQSFPLEENIRRTREYVESHGSDVLVEGILDELAVTGQKEASNRQLDAAYVDRARRYIEEARVDFLVADLGTEQQSSSAGQVRYFKERAVALTERLGEPLLVLHGTSSIDVERMGGLGSDGVIRANMWTRIARDAGTYAAERTLERIERIRAADFEAADPKAYLDDATEKAAEIMEAVLDALGYARLAGTQ